MHHVHVKAQIIQHCRLCWNSLGQFWAPTFPLPPKTLPCTGDRLDLLIMQRHRWGLLWFPASSSFWQHHPCRRRGPWGPALASACTEHRNDPQSVWFLDSWCLIGTTKQSYEGTSTIIADRRYQLTFQIKLHPCVANIVVFLVSNMCCFAND